MGNKILFDVKAQMQELRLMEETQSAVGGFSRVRSPQGFPELISCFLAGGKRRQGPSRDLPLAKAEIPAVKNKNRAVTFRVFCYARFCPVLFDYFDN